MKKKLVFAILGLVVLVSAAVFFAVPGLISHQVKSMLSEEGIVVESVTCSWSGPLVLHGVVIEEEEFSGSLDCTVHSSLIGLVKQSESIHVSTSGQLSIGKHDTLQLDVESSQIVLSPTGAVSLDLQGMHENGGHLIIEATAPSLLDSQYEINEHAEFHASFDIKTLPIPSYESIGGWSIINMTGSISSPDIQSAMNIDLHGSLAEYEEKSGDVQVKLQLTKSEDTQDLFTLGGHEVTGMAHLEHVPSSLLAPFLNRTHIDIDRDIGHSFALQLTHLQQSKPLQFSFASPKCNISGSVDNGLHTFSNVEVNATAHAELIEALTNGRIKGDTAINATIEECTPEGEHFSLVGSLFAEGPIQLEGSNVSVRKLHANVASTDQQSVLLEGRGITNDQSTTFKVVVNQQERAKALVGLIDDVIQLNPTTNASIELHQFPSSVLAKYAGLQDVNIARDVGLLCDLSLTLKDEENIFSFDSNQLQLSGFLELGNEGIERLTACNATGTVHPKLAEEMLGVQFASPVSIAAVIDDIDMAGNSSFNGVYTIGKQQTFIQGKSLRGSHDELQLHLAATGIDTRLIDAMGDCHGLLVDSVGSPIAVECIIDDFLGEPRIQAGGNAPNAAFETHFNVEDQKATLGNQNTVATLQLTPALTQRILKDLGPVLSDIRSVKQPIVMTVSNASVPLNGKVNQLHADVRIDIGEVELDSGAVTLQLLPLFNSSHTEMIPAKFEPIKVQIRKGVVTYEEFNLIIDGKYAVPYAGTINLNNRKLNLTSAVPLTGLGYSIKELRGLATDIDVPLRITGTISEPQVDVDPQFDLSELLQSAALDAIGDAIGDALSGEGDAPDPVKLLEELLGGGS